MTLYDLATVVRSKNAGPFTLVIDLMFADDNDLDRALSSGLCTPERIAELYAVPADSVSTHVLRQAHALKVTMPRQASSGSPLDRDVYGSQQHFPLAGLQLPED